LSNAAVLVVGAANLAADGLSMAVGNFLAIRALESAREAEGLPELEARPRRHAAATFAAFVVAGSIPLAPYVLPLHVGEEFVWSIAATMIALFAVGAARSMVTVGRWWVAGGEMLLLGAMVAAAAYGAGALVAAVIS
jgi:VIT1/CCC1 family predicted Fe2+/Mn2+ transporter